MTIQEILDRHKVAAFTGADTACSCDRTWRTNTEYRAHVAEVLNKHMREREYRAWESGYEEGAVHAVRIRAHVDGLTKHDPKRPANPYRKDTTSGR